MKRRQFIQLGLGAGVAASGYYGYQRGLRYPFISLETKAISDNVSYGNTKITLIDCFVPKHPKENNTNSLFLRAFAPEPSVLLDGNGNTKDDIQLILNNVPKRVRLNVDVAKQAFVSEQIQGINRHITVKAVALPIQLSWQWQGNEEFEFSAIGDSGGQTELKWCLQRAAEIGSEFLLHLGDFNYAPGDYDGAVQYFYNSPLPCYVSMGNHDFRNDGKSYIHRFITEIGPLNNTFNLQGVRFINLDTAASFLPIKGGQRGEFIQQILSDTRDYSDSLVFTHRPFYDPDEERHHGLGNVHEARWLIDVFKQAKVSTCIAGHIHTIYDVKRDGIRLIINGQGTGHQDLIHSNNHVSKLTVGRVRTGKPVEYRQESLLMPRGYHCHPRVEGWKHDNSHIPEIQEYLELCRKREQFKTI